MNRSGIFSCRYFKFGLLGILLVGGARAGSFWHAHARAVGAVPTQTQVVAPLSVNDVSWLFPAPTRTEDFAKLIAVQDLSTQNPHDPAKRDAVWPDAAFQRFIEIASGPAAQVVGTQSRIGLPVEAKSIDAWYIAGVRIDAGGN